MYKYIVYKTTNKVNGYIYIGVHYTDIDIDDQYIGCGLYKSSKSIKRFRKYKFHQAVKKFGANNFIRETLFEFPDSEEGKRLAYKKEAELVNRDFLKRKDVYNSCMGGKVPSSATEKPVAQYTLKGEFITSFYSISHASQETGIPHSSIQGVCSGEIRYSGDYQWRYFTGDTSDIPEVERREKRVFQFDLQGNYLGDYISVAEATRITGLSNIASVLNGRRRSSGGYYWSYKKRFDYVPYDKYTAVACYTDDGTFVKSYDSVNDAAASNNVTAGTISNCIAGRRKHAAKFRWRYFYGNTGNIESLKD